MESQAGCSSTPSSPPSGPVVGIDLGTTYSAVAVYQRGKVEIFSNESGSRTTPSVVGFLGGESFVGEAAQDLPASCQVFDAKRLIGRPYDAILTSEISHWPFMVIEKRGVPVLRVTVNESKKEDFFPEEISAMVLRNLKETAEASLQQTVSQAVITVPAFFNERQRQMTKLAGKIAGLDVIGMINEPTAAAIAYGLDKSKGSDGAKKTIFIYDLGGGTFDVSVMTVSGSDFTVLASGGDTHLGGEDFDNRLLHALIEDVRTQHGVCLDSVSVHELRRACELAKRKLSSLSEVPVSVYFPRPNLNYKTSVTRARFENLCSDLFNKTLTIATDVLADAKVTKDAVDEVVLVGGSTRIPKVRTMLRDFFDGKEPRRSINPDEAVAYGAAVHAAALAAGDDHLFCNMVKLKDVTALSLGIETEGGGFSRVIPRNTPIPCKMVKEYTKCKDACEVLFEVFQGERSLAKDNYNLNKKFTIPTPLPQKDVKIDCCFTIDADGLLTVTATDKVTGASGKVTVTQEEGALSEDAVKDMIERAKRFRDQDARDLLKIQAAQRDEESAQQDGGRAKKRKIRR